MSRINAAHTTNYAVVFAFSVFLLSSIQFCPPEHGIEDSFHSTDSARSLVIVCQSIEQNGLFIMPVNSENVYFATDW